MKLLIINADDFGLTEKVNQGILDAHRHGILTSTSLMANGAAFESAVALARTAPNLGVGVHLNLTQGRPLSGPSSISSLVTREGLFAAGPGRLARKILAGNACLVQVERELRAQIERVFIAGIPPTHLDGHQHIHAWPRVFDLTVRLAREYGIAGIRCSSERAVGVVALLRRNPRARSTVLRQYGAGRVLALLSVGQPEKARCGGLVCPRDFYGVTQTGFLNAACLEGILRVLRGGSSELMCHPGYLDQELEKVPSRLLRQREMERDALTRSEMKKLVSQLGLRLGTYRDIKAEYP